MRDAGVLEAEAFGVADAAAGEEQMIGARSCAPSASRDLDLAPSVRASRGDAPPNSTACPELREDLRERASRSRVHERQDPIGALEQRHLARRAR